MSLIVAVHGIGQQYKGEATLHSTWYPAFLDGLTRAGAPSPDAQDFSCAFYGDVFRGGGKHVTDARLTAADVEDDFERDMLSRWWEEAAATERLPGPMDATKARTPLFIQKALNIVSSSRFFARAGESALIGDLRQVRAYMTDAAVRSEIRERVLRAITPQTRLVIAHSLGSVVAYEALCAVQHAVAMLITLGSPLGVFNLIYDRLDPAPECGRASWPRVRRWVNIADRYDVVALRKALRPLFGNEVEDVLIDNGATAHDIEPYLTARETGQAAAWALAP